MGYLPQETGQEGFDFYEIDLGDPTTRQAHPTHGQLIAAPPALPHRSFRDNGEVRSVAIAVEDGTVLDVASCGSGPDVLVLSGGPGCVHYLADERLAPQGVQAWFPSPRGVAASGGGPHDMTQAVADLEAVRLQLGIERWVVMGHSWGSDLAVRYALDHPDAVAAVVGIAGHGLHLDRSWSEIYGRGRQTEEHIEIAWVPGVHQSLWTSFKDWIHEPTLFRRMADSPVPMQFIAAGEDIRPNWPLQQVAELVPDGSFAVVNDVVHDFWATEPETWVRVTTDACRRATRSSG